jgi:hypothetical protein
VVGLSVGITYIGGLASGSESLRVTGREIIETLALAGATTTVLKYAFGRSRPYANEGPYHYHPFSLTDNHHSLPSGHTTVAFAISSVLAARIQNPIATVLLYSASACTAFSRMYHDQHWLSDLFLGASIGATTGLWVVHRDKEREYHADSYPLDDKGLLISPSIGGVSLTYRF